MTIQTLIKGLLPVCQECRGINGDEPDKCGRLAWCKTIFAAGMKHGATHELTECARWVGKEADRHGRRATMLRKTGRRGDGAAELRAIVESLRTLKNDILARAKA